MLEEISLFPIPGAVSFPFSVKPLHIFEPRYRAMIKDSVDKKRRIGVTHTKGLITTKSTHEHFEPHQVFSAGHPEILETLPDGRMIIQIKMDRRYKIVSEIQQIPYKVVECEYFEDHESSVSEDTKILRRKLDLTLADLLGQQNIEYKKFIESEKWTELSLEEYSFAIYSLVLFDADVFQKILEMQSAEERMSFLYDTLFAKVIQ